MKKAGFVWFAKKDNEINDRGLSYLHCPSAEKGVGGISAGFPLTYAECGKAKKL